MWVKQHKVDRPSDLAFVPSNPEYQLQARGARHLQSIAAHDARVIANLLNHTIGLCQRQLDRVTHVTAPRNLAALSGLSAAIKQPRCSVIHGTTFCFDDACSMLTSTLL